MEPITIERVGQELRAQYINSQKRKEKISASIILLKYYGWEENATYPGYVNSIRSDGKFEVTFDDGDQESDIEFDEIIRFQKIV